MQSRTHSVANFLSASLQQPLHAEAFRVTLALRGHWHGRYGTACCPAHDDRTPSLSVKDGANGQLLLKCHSGCVFGDILNALRALGIADFRGNRQLASPERRLQQALVERCDAEKRARQARQLWLEAVPIDGTLAETYLRSRAITCALPDTLRFHSECWHPTAKCLSAMVARVDGAERFAVHRTYLRPDGCGKADVTPEKAMLGAVQGGAVRLTESEEVSLVVAEGIETALSLACGLLRGPETIWAALSAPGIAALRLPDQPGRLTIATDADDGGAGRLAGNKLAERASALGWKVSLLPAPEDRDWNDVLIMKGAAK